MEWLQAKGANNEYMYMDCLDGKKRVIRRKKDMHGNYCYSFNIIKNGRCWGASHGAYKLNKKIFGDLV